MTRDRTADTNTAPTATGSSNSLGISSPAPSIRSAVDTGRTISADHLRLALVARVHALGTGGTRWAAMSNGADDQGCTRRYGAGGYRLPRPPLLSPMDRGHITRVIGRVWSLGNNEVRRTFGCGIRALMASVPSSILRAGQ